MKRTREEVLNVHTDGGVYTVIGEKKYTWKNLTHMNFEIHLGNVHMGCNAHRKKYYTYVHGWALRRGTYTWTGTHTSGNI